MAFCRLVARRPAKLSQPRRDPDRDCQVAGIASRAEIAIRYPQCVRGHVAWGGYPKARCGNPWVYSDWTGTETARNRNV